LEIQHVAEMISVRKKLERGEIGVIQTWLSTHFVPNGVEYFFSVKSEEESHNATHFSVFLLEENWLPD